MRNVVVAVVVVLAGVTANLGPTGSETQPFGQTAPKQEARKDASDAAAAGKVPENPVSVLADFFEPNEEAGLRLAGKGHVVFSTPRRFAIRFVIAAVPDPEKTLLPLYFDRWVESIILAAQDSSYNYDRFWLPWRRESEPENLKIEDKQRYQEWRRGRMDQPGLLLFRPADPAEPALGIWLVGETPTAGIDAQQFRNSVLYSRELGSRPDCCFRILAPTFSGSVPSLLKALQSDLEPELSNGEVEIATGSASVFAVLKDVPKLRAAVNNDSDLFVSMYSSLERMGYDPHRAIALLAEQGTVFGGGLSGFWAETILYPRDISRLRNIYSDEVQAAMGAADPRIPRQQLSLKLHDAESGKDVLPYMSPQTPVSQESALMQITDTLKANGAKLAIVTGTNVLDVIFLSRYLRRSIPDVRIILYDSDLLFVHGTDTLDYYGMLAVSSYPLLPRYSDPAEYSVIQFFASNAAQGVYRAGLSLIPLVMKPQAAAPPPVWITVVGRGGYAPVDSAGGQAPPISAGPPSRVWVSVFLICSVLSCCYAALLVYARLRKDPVPQWVTMFRTKPGGSGSYRRQSAFSFVTTTAVLLAFAAVGGTALRLSFLPDGDHWVWWARLAVVTIAALGVGLAASTRRVNAVWAATAVTAAGGAVAWFWPLMTGDSPDSKFRVLRTADPFGGVAPNVPVLLLFLSLAFWGWTHMQRLLIVAERAPCLPCFNSPEVIGHLKSLRRWLRQAVLHIDLLGIVVGVVSFAVLLLVCLFHAQSIERPSYDQAVSLSLALTGSLVVLAAYGFLRIWLGLRVLLQSLELRPIRFAFSALPPEFSWSPIWQGNARKRNYLLMARGLDSLRLLAQTEAAFYAGLPRHMLALQAVADRLFAKAEAGYSEDAEDAHRAQRLMAKIADNLERELTRRGWKTATSETLERTAKAEAGSRIRGVLRRLTGGGTGVDVKSNIEHFTPEEKAQAIAAEVVALRYLAFIRYVMLQSRSLLSFLTTGFILTAVALNSYSFQALNLIRWSVTLVFVLLAGVVTLVFLQMDRDAVLSRLADTEAGRLDSQFFVRLISVGALPLLTVIASQFPSVGRFLFAWLQPALAAMH